jgi:hypothetical protein
VRAPSCDTVWMYRSRFPLFEDGSAVLADRSMIVTLMLPKISSRRDIAVLQKESSPIECEADVNDSSLP